MKRFLLLSLSLIMVLSLVLPAPSATAVERAANHGADFLNHRTHAGLEPYSSYIFSEDGDTTASRIFFKNNDMFYNVSDNMYRYGRWSSTMYSFLVENADGGYTRVEPQGYRVSYRYRSGRPFYDEAIGTYRLYTKEEMAYKGENNLVVEIYNKDIELLSTKLIPLPLPIFGGFYSGKDYNFVVVGQENPSASDSVEVLRFLKYSKDWVLLGQSSVYGANTTIPFDAGSLRMTEAAGLLYIHTSHEMYSGHQANMTFTVNQSNMTIKEQAHRVWNISTGYVSHSFNQFIETDGRYIFRADHGDANPRQVVVTRSDVGGSISSVIYTSAFDIKLGEYGNNDTGVSIGGMAIGNNNVLVAGNTEDQENSESFGSNVRNIFLSVTNKALSTTKVVMLTNYGADTAVRVLPPQLVKIDGNRFLLMWEEYNATNGSFKVCAVIVDEQGRKLSEIAGHHMRLSDCQPILCSDGAVRWYVSTAKQTVLYSLVPDNIEETFHKGDVNLDGAIDNLDAAIILHYDVGAIALEDTSLIVADVNNDGKVNSLDAVAVLKHDVGLKMID